MIDREGVALLRHLIKVTAGMDVLVRDGDCKSIAIAVNGWLLGCSVSEADVYAAIKDREDFGGPTMNVEILRARIDAMPVLTSARLSGDLQAILNELNFDPQIVGKITVADVKAAMDLRRVPRPTLIASGAAGLKGVARIG